MSKPIVWLVNPYAVPPEYPASTRHFELAKELNNNGFSIVMWACSFIHVVKEYVKPDAKRPFSLYQETLPFTLWNWLWSTSYKVNNKYRIVNMLLFSAHLLIRGMFFSPRPDIIIGSSPHMFGALACLVIAKLRGSKFIFEVRDLWPDTLIDMNPRTGKITKKILLWLEKILYKHSDAVMPLTPGIKKRLIKDKNVPENKICLVPNGVAVDTFVEAQQTDIKLLINSLGIDGKFVVLYAGAHGQANALHSVVECAEKLKDNESIVFLLVGDGQERSSLITYVKEKHLQNVKIIGPVNKKKLAFYLQAADICLLTLKDISVFNTALPNKIFDYAYFNKPIVVAVRGDAANFVVENNLGIAVEPEQPDNLAEAIYGLSKQKNTINYGSKGRELVLTEYSRENTAKHLVQLIKQWFYVS